MSILKKLGSIFQIPKSGPLNVSEWFSLIRILLFPIVTVFLFLGFRDVFSWAYLLVFSTDFIDGFFAKFHSMESARRAQLDTLGDFLMLVLGIYGVYYYEKDFFIQYLPWILFTGIVYLVEIFISIFRFRRIINLHTFMAKFNAVVLVGFIFFTLFYQPVPVLFFITIVFSLVTIAEEIYIILSLNKARTNVNGFWEV